MKTNLHLKSILTVVMAAMTILPASAAKAKNKFQNFKVSTYIRAQDVAMMATEKINPSLRRLGKRGIADYYKMENWRGGLEGIVLESVEHG